VRLVLVARALEQELVRVLSELSVLQLEGFLFHPRFSLDDRENAKMRRGELKRLARPRDY